MQDKTSRAPTDSGQFKEIQRPTVWILGQFDAGFTLATQLAGAVVVVLIGAIIAEVLYQAFDLTRLAIFFLGSVIVSALAFGMRAAILAAFLAFAAYNFSLVEPRFTFQFAGADDTLTLAVFLVVALLTGSLAGKVRESERNNRQRADLLATLFDASRIFMAKDGEPALRADLACQLETTTGGLAIVLGADAPLSADRIADLGIPEALLAQVARSQEFHTSGAWRARVISTEDTLGTAIWRIGETRAKHLQSQDRLCELLLDLAAASLARARLANLRAEAEADRRAEPLRNAILSSLSHDLRTPLSTVLASASSLRDYDAQFDSATRTALADGIVQEAGRLNDYLEGLLNLSRIESGDLEPRLLDVSIAEVVGNVIGRLGAFGSDSITFHDANPPADVRADPVLLEQVIFNLLENVAHHGGEGVQARMFVSRLEEAIEFSIEDTGPGVSDVESARLFDRFYRGASRRADGRGTGVGLSIAKGFVEAMGGSIRIDPTVGAPHGLKIVVRIANAVGASL